jgi:alpha-L-fucosidase
MPSSAFSFTGASIRCLLGRSTAGYSPCSDNVQRAAALVFKFLFRRYAEWYWLSAIHPGEQFAESRAYHQQNYAGTDYMDMADGFRAELFNASYWADLFYRSGAKYIVPTSKHHDGFALWPSVHASRAYGRPWNAVDVGPKRDLIGEIAAAVRARGLKFGIYYSLYEWFHPLWRPEEEGTVADYVSTHLLPQLKDVVQRYGPSLIFSDGEWDLPSHYWRSEEFLAWLYNESPSKAEVIVNDRWGKECRHKCAGYFT